LWIKPGIDTQGNLTVRLKPDPRLVGNIRQIDDFFGELRNR